ncbi:unnamed protein product [Caenorhabditis bovis]|uniref:Myosin N-terminal SH3-like domain-containing protein n=1 Tax=Caenorhabditis bovis TaxID=2654633 RepID=A0A8S1E7C6_9PELO|nr:unnamed protein product [Caenorhabditis bovis]
MDYENDPGWKYLRRSREEMLKDQSKAYDSKKNCWIPDAEEGYVEAIITKTSGDTVTVQVGQGVEKTVKKEVIQEMNPPKFEKTEDMSNLTFLNDASVLHNLRARYAAMLIYLERFKKQLESAVKEEQANNHLSKYRTVQLSLETAEERADSAEQCLVRIRSRTRATAEQK